MRRWRVGAADAVRGRGLFVLGGAIGTKEAVGGGGYSAGRLSLSATRGSAPCADPLGCPEHSLSAPTGFLAASQRGQDGIKGDGSPRNI